MHRIEQIEFEINATSQAGDHDLEIQAANEFKVYRELAGRIMPGNIAYVVLFFWTLYAVSFLQQEPVLMYVCGSFIVLGALVRTYLAKKVDSFKHQLKCWRYVFSISTLMVAAAWSVLSLYAVQAALDGADNDDLMLMCMLVFAVISGGMNVLAVFPFLWRLFVVILIVPMAIGLFIIGSHSSIALALMLLLAFSFSLKVGGSIHRDYWQRIENESSLERQAAVLSKARDIALEAVQAKSAFLANMSHEIRTPMNGVLGMVSLLQTTALNRKQQGFTDAIRRSGDSLLRIINDILDFSKIDANKLLLETAPFCLRNLIHDVVELLSEQARGKHINILTQFPPHLHTLIMGDRLRLQQVLINLVANAIKFTDKGEVAISIREVKRTDACVQLYFSVSDSGIGIAEENQRHIFKAFAQTDASTTRQYGGTGLGLAICKNIVSSMGGDIQLHSELGHGSTFSFELEFPLADDEAVDSGARDELAGQTNGSRRQSDIAPAGDRFIDADILIVEDNEVNQLITCTMLEEFGCRTQIACNGRKAIDAFINDDFDLILMDCQMPVLDGYGATRSIRGLEQEKTDIVGRIPIVALTAHAMRGDRDLCLNAGMDGYMTKPFTKEQLLDKLRFHLPDAGKMMVGQSKRQSIGSIEEVESPASALDAEVIGLLPGGPAMLQKVLAMFLKSLSTLMQTMQDGVEQGDTDQVMRASHTLKSSSAMVGAMTLSALCKDVEAITKRGELVGVADLVQQANLNGQGLEKEIRTVYLHESPSYQ